VFQVPDHAPCKLDGAFGRCISGKCELSDLNLDTQLRDYSLLAPANGAFDQDDSASSKLNYDKDHCIDIEPVARMKCE